MNFEGSPAPVHRRLLTPGVGILFVLALVGLLVTFYRFLFGLAAITNLDQQHPWGLWIAIDVATGVALAAGGFTTTALAHVFHREHFRSIARPALLTALLGYTFVGIGLLVDLGRYYNIWHPAWPTMWQGNSVLFEVGMCVMCYITVLYLEFLPIVCERLMSSVRRPRLARVAAAVKRLVERTMFVLIIAGVVLSCLHQSSLGALLVIAPSKMHALWYTPILPLLFLLSAMAAGFPMVIVESSYASWSLKLTPERHLLTSLSTIVPVLLGVYLAVRISDLFIRNALDYVFEDTMESLLFLVEIIGGVIVPLVMFLSRSVRGHTRLRFIAALLVVLGVALNRVNVFLVAYQPPYAARAYVPSLGEFAVTIGLASLLILTYRVIVTYLPVIAAPPRAESRG